MASRSSTTSSNATQLRLRKQLQEKKKLSSAAAASNERSNDKGQSKKQKSKKKNSEKDGKKSSSKKKQEDLLLGASSFCNRGFDTTPFGTNSLSEEEQELPSSSADALMDAAIQFFERRGATKTQVAEWCQNVVMSWAVIEPHLIQQCELRLRDLKDRMKRAQKRRRQQQANKKKTDSDKNRATADENYSREAAAEEEQQDDEAAAEKEEGGEPQQQTQVVEKKKEEQGDRKKEESVSVTQYLDAFRAGYQVKDSWRTWAEPRRKVANEARLDKMVQGFAPGTAVVPLHPQANSGATLEHVVDLLTEGSSDCDGKAAKAKDKEQSAGNNGGGGRVFLPRLLQSVADSSTTTSTTTKTADLSSSSSSSSSSSDSTTETSEQQLVLLRHVRFVKGEVSGCYDNAHRLLVEQPIVTADSKPRALLRVFAGYALSRDGLWRSHAWLVDTSADQGEIVETTTERIAYFGCLCPCLLCSAYEKACMQVLG